MLNIIRGMKEWRFAGVTSTWALAALALALVLAFAAYTAGDDLVAADIPYTSATLEVLYDIDTLEIRAWNADDATHGNFKPKAGQKIVIVPGGPPDFRSDIYHVDLGNKLVVGNPDYVTAINTRDEARDRALTAILANKDAAPWGRILYDLAVADGSIEPPP